jgi:NADPH:quinone reductase-like Zn-dependent oxidoreductase
MTPAVLLRRPTVRGRLQPGETVLVHGAAGGIGTSALRLAPAFGASRIIAVVSTQGKLEIATAAGATDVVLAANFKDAVKELTNGRGVDIVVDPVGGDRFTDSLRSLAPAGRLLVLGFTGGEIPTVKVNRLLLNNVDVVGVGWGAWMVSHPGAMADQWSEVEPLLAAGKLLAPKPVVYQLGDAAAAIASLENRTAKGKVVLNVRG